MNDGNAKLQPTTLRGLRRITLGPLCWLFRRKDFRGKARLYKLTPLPRRGTYTVHIPHGPQLDVDMAQEMERQYYFGIYDLFRLKLIRTLLAGGGDFVDVGANIGLFAAAASMELGTKGRVLAFEPNPSARARLIRHLSLNGCDNATVVPYAASDTASSATLRQPQEGDLAWSTLETSKDFGESETIAIQTRTVDSEVARLGMKPTFVKIDAQGYEPQTLRGMTETLRGRPAVMCTIAAPELRQVMGLMNGMGYEALRLVKHRLVTQPWSPRLPWGLVLFVTPERIAATPAIAEAIR